MTRTHKISFEYEIDELGTFIDVEATVTFPNPAHPHPMDPDHNAECEITRVSKDDSDLDPYAVMLLRKNVVTSKGGIVTKEDTHVLLLNLLEDAAWIEAAEQGEDDGER